MISDVLFEAIEKIQNYQQTFPQVYDDLEKEINLVVAGLDWLQHRLDQGGTETSAAIMYEEGGHGLGSLELRDSDRDAGQSGETGEITKTSETTFSMGERDTHPTTGAGHEADRAEN